MSTIAQWGILSWGSALWGDGPAYGYEGDTANAKADTRLYLNGSQTVDSSQYDTDLTASGSYAGYEAASSRGALTTAWTLEHRADYDYTSHNGKIILVHSNDAGTSYTYRIRCGASGIECAINGVLITTLAVGSGAVDRSIFWSMRSNDDTTGAGDAYISEFGVYDHDSGDWEIDLSQVAHAAPTSDVSWNLCVHGQWDDGLSTLNNEFPVAIAMARVSNYTHSHVEHCEDFVSARALVASNVKAYAEPLPIDKDSGLGDEGEIVGPTLSYLCDHHRNAVVRSFSPLVNEVYNQTPNWVSAYTPANFMRKVTGTSMRMPLTYLRWVAVPQNCSHIYARVHARSWVSSGSSVPVKVACVSMNFPPGVTLNIANDNEPAPVHVRYYGHTTIDVDDTSTGTGQWLDLGVIKLARNTSSAEGWWGTTFLALAYEIDPNSASSNDANARVEFRAWTVWPLSEDPKEDGITPDQVLPQDS